MRCAILGDTHFSTRQGSKVFSDFFEKFFENTFFPYLIENNIDTVIQLGDLFCHRRYINFNGFSDSKRFFFDKLQEHNIQLYVLVGNHDSVYKDTISLNSPDLLLNEYNNIHLIDKPSTITIKDKFDLCIIPWICKENYEDSIKEIKLSKSDICFGHFEIAGFAMYKGVIRDEGLDNKLFDKYEFVFSGHYHHRSTKNNIYYLGTPYELTWNDDSDQKGFHIFDLENRKLEFIKNPHKIFNKIYYDDVLNEDYIKKQIEDNIFENIKETYIKIVVKTKDNPYLFDLFVDSIYKNNPIDVTIIEDVQDVLLEEINDVDETEDTLTIINTVIDNIKTKDLDSNKLKHIMSSLYSEAISVQS